MLIPDRWPSDSHCPEVIEQLTGVNRFMICGPQQKITRGTDVADLRSIYFERGEIVAGESGEKIHTLLMKGR